MASEVFGTTLVPFDFDGNGSTDALFYRGTTTVGDLPVTEYAMWTSGPQGLTSQAVIGQNSAAWSLPFFADFDGNGSTDLLFNRFTTVGDATTIQYAVWTLDGTTVTGQAILGSTSTDWFVAPPFFADFFGFSNGFGTNGFGDFDGNGTADLLFARLVDGVGDNPDIQYAVWTTNGTSLLGQAIIGSTTIDWRPISTDDFDGNGTSDLLFERFTGDDGEAGPLRTEYAVWTLNGTQVTGQAIIGSVTADSGWDLIELADFDGNGSSDLLFDRFVVGSNDVPDAIQYAMWTTNGAGLLSQAIIGSTTTDWDFEFTSDLDGNGTADLLFTRFAGENTDADPLRTDYAVWTMDGTQVTGQAIIGSVTADSGWFDIDFNDFNGDGGTDILFAKGVETGTEFAVWLLDGAGVLAQKVVGIATDGWNYVGSADFNGDGTADLGFVKFETLEVAVWTMGADGSVTSQSIIGTFDNPTDLAGWFPTAGETFNLLLPIS